jgi:hypothetical protein
MLRFSVRTQYFASSPEGCAQIVLVRRLVEHLADAGGLYYALVHTALWLEDGAGLRYDFDGPLDGNLSNQINCELWGRYGEKRREKVRGVYWGQYLSAQHLVRLGGRASFIKEYRDLVRKMPSGETFVREVGDGVFVKVCENPMNFSVFGLDVPCDGTGAWLYERFRDAGLLL